MKTARTNPEENISLRFKLQTFMKEKGLTQRDISAYTGLSQTNISFILSGIRFPSEATLERIKKMFEFFKA